MQNFSMRPFQGFYGTEDSLHKVYFRGFKGTKAFHSRELKQIVNREYWLLIFILEKRASKEQVPALGGPLQLSSHLTYDKQIL